MCGREKGGSQTKLIFNGEKVRLHQVWDSHLLHRHKNMTFQNNISRYSTHMLGLARKIVKTEKRTSFSSSSSWSNSNWLQVIQWARRTKGVDCSTVWPTFDSFHPHSHSNYTAASKPANHKLAHGESSLIITPSYDLALNGYYDAVIDTVEQQVVLGGIWMAEMVNFLANEVGWSSSFSAGGEGGYGNYYDHQVSSLESLDDRSSSSTSSSTFSHQDPHRSSPTLVKIKNRKRKGSFTLPICQRMFMHYNLDRIIRFLPSTTSSTSTSAPTNKPTSTSSSSSLSKLVTNPVSTSTPHKKKKKNKKRHRHYHHHQNSPQVINIPRESEVDDEDITAEAMARWFETRLYHMAVDKEEEDGSDGSDDMMVVVMEDEKNVDAKENVLEHQTTRPTKRKKHWHRNRRRVRNGE